MEKNMKARVQHKHDIEANWLRAINFTPLISEIIVYDPDESYDYPRIKIGDGKTNINSLPFVTVALEALIDTLDTDKLDASKLPEAINDALAQAKESGEFDGEKGEPGNSGVYIGSTKPVDPDVHVWINPDEEVDKYVKSVNGVTPDENGNVEIKIPESSGSSVTIDPTLTKSGAAADAKAVGDALAELEKKIPEQSGSPELFDKADLPIDPQSFVTVDGVEYYRYHAGPTNFTWNNPHPQTGSVTITARGVSQYVGSLSARLKTVYNDGTFGPDIYIVVGGESRTASVTTDENKTLAKITGNYDLENWVLLDMSVMSVRADYLVQEECILPVATADTLGGVKPVAKGTDMTQKVGVDELGGLWTAPGGGDNWEKINEFTLEENALTVLFDADTDGNPFSLKKMRIFMNLPKLKNTSGEDVNTGYARFVINGIGAAYQNPSSGWEDSNFVFTLESVGNYVEVRCLKGWYNRFGAGNDLMIWHMYKHDKFIGGITSFLWSIFEPNADKPSAMAGATFDVWGVRV